MLVQPSDVYNLQIRACRDSKIFLYNNNDDNFISNTITNTTLYQL